MNNVHLKVHQLSVDGMFCWGMEMELLSMEICFFDMRIKKSDGGGAQVVLRGQVVSWLLGLLDWEEEGLNGLVELV